MSSRAANTNGSDIRHTESASGRDTRASSHAVVVRIPAELLLQIDEVVQHRLVRVPRHTWLLEAINEKLQRDARSVAPAGRGGRRRHGAK